MNVLCYTNFGRCCYRLITIHAFDRQTDGRTDGFTPAKTALRKMQRGKMKFQSFLKLRSKLIPVRASLSVFTLHAL